MCKFKRTFMVAVILICTMFTIEVDAAQVNYDSSTEIVSNSAVTAVELDQAFAGTGLAGLGQAFVDAEHRTGVNAVFLAALAAHESAWGESWLATSKNNLFGFGAYDDNPTLAYSYASTYDCVQSVADFMLENYGTPGGCYYVDGTISGVNSVYASSPAWSAAVVGEMCAVDQR